jgi:general L-amino acid transport system permease protein
MRMPTMAWLRRNLFSSPVNSVTTVVLIVLMVMLAVPVVDWALISADWIGVSRAACSGDGACWVFVSSRLGQFVYGFYPEAERWRADLAMALNLGVIILLFLPDVPKRGFLIPAGLFIALFGGWLLLYGGVMGLAVVETRQWGGMMLTLVITIAGLFSAFPLGIALALGRRSDLPAIRAICIVFIEFWRGIPLITVLFMASVMLPLFLPDGANFDKLLRALIGVTMFAGAYLAEVVRGGLQAVPRGQYEAAAALGLSYGRTMVHVILPQALRHVIPGIANTAIALFKDTTLVLVIGLFDFLGIIQAALTDTEWLGMALEGYVFAAAVYWVLCFTMSRASLRLERRNVGSLR